MTALLDLRYSARKFARSPGLSSALLLTIALGIGSNVAVHGFVRGLTRPASPLASDPRLVSIFGQGAHREAGPLTYQDYQSLQNRTDAFDLVGAARISHVTVTLAGQSPIMTVAAITPSLAGLLNLSSDAGILISHSVWQNEFRSQPDVRGEHIRIAGVDVLVSGVAPEWLEGLYRDRPVDLWMPWPEETSPSIDRNVWVLARLRPGISIDQAQGSAGLRVVPYTDMTPAMADGLSRVGALLNLAAGLVLIIACANVASFLLGRATARSHETSIRVALGAGRGQLARALLSDSIVISVAGGAFGALLATWTSHILPTLLFENDAEHFVSAPDIFSIVLASVACVAVTIVCGLLPVFTISNDRPAIVLRRESAGPSPAIRRLRVGLVVAQMTSCCVLVIATAHLFEGLRSALQTSAGHHLSNAILATAEARPFIEMKYFGDVQRAAQSVPGVSAIAWATRLPGARPTRQAFRVDPPQSPTREVAMDTAEFTAASLALLDHPPVAGRLFGASDQTCRAAVVNEEAAAALFGKDSVGRSIVDPAGLSVNLIGVLPMKQSAGRPTIYYYDADRTGVRRDQPSLAHFRAPTVAKLETAELDAQVVSPDYFDAMGWQLVAGRSLSHDPTPRGCRAAVINQEASDLYFHGAGVGASVIDESGRRTGIIGVVEAVPLVTFEPSVEPAIYFPMAQDYPRRMTLILGAKKADDRTLAALRSSIESVPGRGRSPLVVQTLDTLLNQTALAPLRIATVIIGASATTAVLLSVLGLFGALSDAARQRRRELAVRIALGAPRWRVVGLVLKEGGRLACAGALAGTLGSLLLSRMLTRIAPNLASPALWVWLAAPIVLAAAVAIASVLPARSALIVNPVTIMSDSN